MKSLTRLTFAVMILAAVLTLHGCAGSNSGSAVPGPPLIPGAVNSFDQVTYQTLLSVSAAITAAMPLATTAATQKILNDVINAYDAAEAAYVIYHNAAVAGSATAAQQTALQAQVATATTAMAKLPAAALQPAAPAVTK